MNHTPQESAHNQQRQASKLSHEAPFVIFQRLGRAGVKELDQTSFSWRIIHSSERQKTGLSVEAVIQCIDELRHLLKLCHIVDELPPGNLDEALAIAAAAQKVGDDPIHLIPETLVTQLHGTHIHPRVFIENFHAIDRLRKILNKPTPSCTASMRQQETTMEPGYSI